MPAAIALGVPALTEHQELAAIAMVPAAIALSRFSFLWFARSRPIFESGTFKDLVHNFWSPGLKSKNIPQQFEMVRPDVLRNLRILTNEELDVFSRSPSNKAARGPSWDVLYLLGMLNGPYGSHGTPYKIGNQLVVRVDEEKKTSGLIIEYWPLLGVAFAKNPESWHLPQSLADSFTKAARPIRMICIRRNGEGPVYDDTFLTQAEYDSEVDVLRQMPAREIYRLPEETGKFLTPDYPLPPLTADEDSPRDDSEWSQDSKAATLAEVLGKMAELGAKGIHLG